MRRAKRRRWTLLRFPLGPSPRSPAWALLWPHLGRSQAKRHSRAQLRQSRLAGRVTLRGAVLADEWQASPLRDAQPVTEHYHGSRQLVPPTGDRSARTPPGARLHQRCPRPSPEAGRSRPGLPMICSGACLRRTIVVILPSPGSPGDGLAGGALSHGVRPTSPRSRGRRAPTIPARLASFGEGNVPRQAPGGLCHGGSSSSFRDSTEREV